MIFTSRGITHLGDRGVTHLSDAQITRLSDGINRHILVRYDRYIRPELEGHLWRAVSSQAVKKERTR